MDLKPTLIIIPGWGGSCETWQSFIDLAQNDFGVHCIELPCFGNEPCPNEVWGVEEYAHFVKEKIAQIKAQNLSKNLILLGHSFGGQVAAQLVGTNPGICDTLILTGPAIFRKSWSLKRIVFWPIAKFGKIILSLPGLNHFSKLAKKVLYKAVDSPDYSETSGIKRQIFQKITRQDVSIFLTKIIVPALVVSGDHDTYVPWRLSQRAAEQIPNGKFVLVSHGRHGLHIDNPNNLLTIIKNFINQL